MQAKNDIRDQISKSAFNIETDAKRRAPSDTGRLRSSIQTEIRSAGFEAVIFSDVNYALPVEEGAKAHFPPPSALSGWARRHGLVGLEFIIARSIARRGLPPRPFLKPAADAEKEDFMRGIRRALRRMEG